MRRSIPEEDRDTESLRNGEYDEDVQDTDKIEVELGEDLEMEIGDTSRRYDGEKTPTI